MYRIIKVILKVFCLAVVVTTFVSGCGAHQRYHPVSSTGIAFVLPAQQETMYEAVEAAAGKLSFKQLNGQTVYIELVGVYPPSHEQLLDYIKDAVAYQLAKSGAVITSAPSEATYKVVIAVQEAGVDIWNDDNLFVKKKYVQGKVAVKVTAYPIRSGPVYLTNATAEGRQRIVHHSVLGWSQQTDYTTIEPRARGGTIMKVATITVPLTLILILLSR